MEFREVLRRRRMVRSFTDEPLPEGALDRILDAARRGPSAGYSQGVEFVAVTDAATRRQLAPPGRGDGFVAKAPAAIVVCASAEIYRSRYWEPDKAAARAGLADDDFWLVPYWHTDAGAALMLILLAAVDEGLGAGVAGVTGEAGQARIRTALGMPASYMAVAIVAVGRPGADAGELRGSAATRPRRPLDELVHRERW